MIALTPNEKRAKVGKKITLLEEKAKMIQEKIDRLKLHLQKFK